MAPSAQRSRRRTLPPVAGPGPLRQLLVATLAVAAAGNPAGRTVLVLAGGGAKGAWAVGVLRGICEQQGPTWQVLSGTSIGALSAGILAQFPQKSQCTEGLVALENYWRGIHSVNDVWQATQSLKRFGNPGPAECLNPRNLLAGVNGFLKYGGLCDPSPGARRYQKAVSAAKIRQSGMALKVTAASLATGQPKVFTERSPNIVDGCMASGSIAPIVYPKEINGDLYVDGGIFHNTPLLDALDGGVRRAIVIMLSPLEEPPTWSPEPQNGTSTDDKKSITGFEVLEWYFRAIYSTITDRRELAMACEFFPHVRIEAAIPKEAVGSLVDFTPEAIRKMRRAGLNFVREHGLVDACSLVGVSRRHRLMRHWLGFDPFSFLWEENFVGLLAENLFGGFRDGLKAATEEAAGSPAFGMAAVGMGAGSGGALSTSLLVAGAFLLGRFSQGPSQRRRAGQPTASAVVRFLAKARGGSVAAAAQQPRPSRPSGGASER